MELINGTLNLSYAAIALLLMVYTRLLPLTISRVTLINRSILTWTFLLLLSDGFACVFLSEQPRLYNLFITLSLVCFYIILALYSTYIISVIQEKNVLTDMALILTLCFCILGSVLRFANYLHPFVDLTSRTILLPKMYWCVESIGIFILLVDFLLLLRYHSKISSMEWFSLSLMPLSAPVYYILRAMIPGLRIRNALIFGIILWNHMFIGLKRDMELWNKEQQLAEYRYILSLERVKPHYIYNVLTSIYYLCDSDPKKAQNAVKTFSEYLRKSLYTMDQTKTVPFQWEMDLIRHYLSLEKMRFPDTFQVDYEITEQKFELPPFTVQILVENSVKHAVSRRTDQNGRIRIAAEKTSGGYRIEVADNGTGQTSSAAPSGGNGTGVQASVQRHNSGNYGLKQEEQLDTYESIGLNNVRERLSLLCGGTLTIQPNAENGITASVFLPFQDTDR